MTRFVLDSLKGDTEFARFCIIGALGFIVDAGLLALLVYGAGADPLMARIISILTAITVTWGLHRGWTFKSEDPAKLAEWSRYLTVSGAGGALNFLIFASVLGVAPVTPPMIAMAIGSGIALLANYSGSRLWAFRAGTDLR